MNSKTIMIHCGVRDNSDSVKKIFWPVLEPIKCPITIEPEIFRKSYQLIFSSKTAIKFFHAEFSKEILENCTGVYFVGESSKEFFQKKYAVKEQLLFIPDAPGMENLIKKFKLNECKESLLFVVAKTGRSLSAIQSFTYRTQPSICSIYDVIPYESDFLTSLMQSIKMDGQFNLVFECHSGKVLTQVIKFLMKYFGCSDIMSLPKNVFFSCFGQSTLDKVREFYE